MTDNFVDLVAVGNQLYMVYERCGDQKPRLRPDRVRVGDTGIELGQLKGLASCVVGAVEAIIMIRTERERQCPTGSRPGGAQGFPQLGERKTPRPTRAKTGSGIAWLSPILPSRNEINSVTTDSTEVDPIEIEIASRDPTANTSWRFATPCPAQCKHGTQTTAPWEAKRDRWPRP